MPEKTAPPFWPPQVGDVWLGNIRETPTTPFAFVCAQPGWLMGSSDWTAENAYRTFGPLRLVWRDGEVATAMHSSELAAAPAESTAQDWSECRTAWNEPST